MRVAIEHSTLRRGLLFKKTFYVVSLSVAFSFEEKQIIRQRKLLKTKLLDRRPATAKVDDRDEQFELRMEHIFNGKVDKFFCATPSKAKIYAEDLELVMEEVKAWLNDNAEEGKRVVIEL